VRDAADGFSWSYPSDGSTNSPILWTSTLIDMPN